MGQGRENARNWLKENKEAREKIHQLVLQKSGVTPNTPAKTAAEAKEGQDAKARFAAAAKAKAAPAAKAKPRR